MAYINQHPRDGMMFCSRCQCSFVSIGGVAAHERQNPRNHPPKRED